ncbi:MAG TPA: hypothetical protein VH538_04820 [Gaiellaceae bacterium]|jgi:hypothetical protein
MFPPTSRYAKAATYQARTPDRRVVAALVIPAPRFPPPLGYHPRAVGDRLDLIAQRYLNDPTGFWRLCDANNALVAGALEQRALIAVPPVRS